jgi:hypothetical protein
MGLDRPAEELAHDPPERRGRVGYAFGDEFGNARIITRLEAEKHPICRVLSCSLSGRRDALAVARELLAGF